MIRDLYADKLKEAAESLYRALESNGQLDLVDNTDDLACAIFLSAGLKELGNNPDMIANAFDADGGKVQALLSAAVEFAQEENEEKVEKDEID